MADETKTESKTPETVPYDRFQTVVTEKNTLATEVTNLRSEVQKLSEKAATVDTLTTQINEWKNKASDAEGRYASFTEIASALGSTDPEVIGLFDQKYKGLPAENRPARPDWIKSLKEKPDDASPLLRPFLGAGNQAATGTEDTKTKTTETPAEKKTPRANGGGPNPPGAPSQYSDAEIARIHAEAKRTGDWSKYREIRKQWAGK